MKHKLSKDTNDIVTIILEEHKPLKAGIKILKNTKETLEKRKKALKTFASQLVTHATLEEEILYAFLQGRKDLKEAGFEGQVQHGLADQMLSAVLETNDADIWSAQAKILAELVEHHVQEEEQKMLPRFQSYSTKEARLNLGARYLEMKTQWMASDRGDQELFWLTYESENPSVFIV